MPKFIKLLLLFCLFAVCAISAAPAKASILPYKLRGHFLIQTDYQGRAWYVDMENGLRHYLPNNPSSLNVISRFSMGVSNADLLRMPIGVDSRFVRRDSDNDTLDDRVERAIGTNPFNADSDGDSYGDGQEVEYNYNPLGRGKWPIDIEFASGLAGRMLLQAQGKGQIWYVNPKDSRRYYIGDHEDLFRAVKYLGTGIITEHIKYIADAAVIRKDAPKNIKIDTGKAQRLYYFLGETQIGSFPVSAGKPLARTPTGSYNIINKHPKAWSPYGLWMPYWMGLGTGRFGLHELPIWPNGYREGEDHLGTPVSHGCIRLGIGPAEYLYNWAEVGTPVYIYRE